jgi:hypothetical protein
MSLKLPYHAEDHLEPQAGLRLIDVKAIRQTDALVRNLDMKMSVDFRRADLDNAITIGVGVLNRICNEFIDQESQRN